MFTFTFTLNCQTFMFTRAPCCCGGKVQLQGSFLDENNNRGEGDSYARRRTHSQPASRFVSTRVTRARCFERTHWLLLGSIARYSAPTSKKRRCRLPVLESATTRSRHDVSENSHASTAGGAPGAVTGAVTAGGAPGAVAGAFMHGAVAGAVARAIEPSESTTRTCPAVWLHW